MVKKIPMKTLIFLFTSLVLSAYLSCGPTFESEIKELHANSRQAGDEVAPKLEALTQRANSINIQGRALTPEEIEFTGQVASLQETFAQWNKDMEKAEAMQPTKKRFDLEQKLNEAIGAFVRQVEALAPRPGI